MKKRNQENPTQQEKWAKQYDVVAGSLLDAEDTILNRLAVAGSIGIQASLLLGEFETKSAYLKQVDCTQAAKVIAAGALQLEELRALLKANAKQKNIAEAECQRVRTTLVELTSHYLAFVEKFRATVPSNRKLKTLHRFFSDLVAVVRELHYGLQSSKWSTKI